jgi:hypothetical protein
MKLLPTSVGAEPKKLAILAAIVVAGGIAVYWSNSGSDAPQSASASGPSVTPLPEKQSAPEPAPAPVSASPGPKIQTRSKAASSRDFHPSLNLPEGVDVRRIDPRLKTELLARLQEVPEEAGKRSVFEFYTPPPPPPPPVAKITPKAPEVRPPPPSSIQKGPPPPPPIPLKYFGFTGPKETSPNRALFLDGDEPLIASENDVLRNRYKIIRIGPKDAEVEDTVNHNKQTLNLVPEADTDQ